MARTQAGAELTRRYRRQQLSLRAATVGELMTLAEAWSRDPASFGPFASGTAILVELRRRGASALASRYYQAFRTAEGVSGEATPRLAEALRRERVLGSIYSAGLGSLRRGLNLGRSFEDARRVALVSLAGTVTRLVLDGGRETILGSVAADRQAQGWQRVTASNPCSFCAMLASRGPAYTSVGADFQAHSHCACSAEPVYRGGGWTPQAQQFRATWDEATDGLSGDEARIAFRRTWEGRAISSS